MLQQNIYSLVYSNINTILEHPNYIQIVLNNPIFPHILKTMTRNNETYEIAIYKAFSYVFTLVICVSLNIDNLLQFDLKKPLLNEMTNITLFGVKPQIKLRKTYDQKN
jgi:hypothetical protein